jgi:hypothetical protein
MVKNSSSQNGNTFAVILIILVVAIAGLLGFIFWQNSAKQDNVTQNSTTDQDKESAPSAIKDPYTLNNAVADINTVLSRRVCGNQSEATNLEQSNFIIVADAQTFNYQGGKSFINEGLDYAYVQYGCGSQGSIALLKRTDDTWRLISNDARVYPMCEDVRGEGFPISIVDKCYEDDHATEPVGV